MNRESRAVISDIEARCEERCGPKKCSSSAQPNHKQPPPPRVGSIVSNLEGHGKSGSGLTIPVLEGAVSTSAEVTGYQMRNCRLRRFTPY